MEIKYNQEVEVNLRQYKLLRHPFFNGIVAHRVSNGRYFIKVLLMRYADDVKLVLVS